MAEYVLQSTTSSDWSCDAAAASSLMPQLTPRDRAAAISALASAASRSLRASFACTPGSVCAGCAQAMRLPGPESRHASADQSCQGCSHLDLGQRGLVHLSAPPLPGSVCTGITRAMRLLCSTGAVHLDGCQGALLLATEALLWHQVLRAPENEQAR